MPPEQRTIEPAGAAQPADAAAAAPSQPAKKRSPMIYVVLALALAGVVYGVKTYVYNLGHVSTDDAQVATWSVDVAPQIAGTVEKVFVSDNQKVRKGDLLIQLDDRKPLAAVQQAQANLDAAVAQAEGAGASVSLTRQTGDAQISQAEGSVGQAQSGIASAEADLAKAGAGIVGARADESTARANVGSAQSGLVTAQAERDRDRAGVAGAQAVVRSAEAQVRAADAKVNNAQASADLASKDAARYDNLVGQGAVSRQEADAKAAAAQTALAALDAAKQEALAARADLAQRQTEVSAATQTLASAQAGIAQARSAILVNQSKQVASGAAYGQTLAIRKAAADEVKASHSRLVQAMGQLAEAQTSGAQTDVSKAARLQAVAKVEQMRALLAQAQLDESYTRIYAPNDGRITKKNVDTGQLVQVGSPLFTLVDESNVWIVADFKETQLSGIATGKVAEIEIDGVPGKTFKGRVQSIQAGTGATFTLLPPDNASGNFTKVVQRVPVKIVFDPGQPDLDRLRAGMSAVAVVDL